MKIHINLSKLLPLEGKLAPSINLERIMVEEYSTVYTSETEGMYERYVRRVLNTMFRADGDYTYDQLGVFFDIQKFVAMSNSYYNYLNSFINTLVPVTANNIRFSRYVVNTPTELVVEFEYEV